VLNNLISNALKYSPRGGEIVVGARAEEKNVLLWVADRGIGIPAHAMPHLFDKFYRVEHSDRALIAGTGLGLATVRQIVQIHRGKVWAESISGEGSTFFVSLPCPEHSQVVRIRPPQAEASSAPVLLVEDDAAFARLLREHLAAQGTEIRHTMFAEEALEWCRKHPPKILLLDLHLAGAMDGWDLLLELKHDHRLQKIPVVVMAGSEPNLHGLALGGADYALKTASPEVLRLAVLRQLPSLTRKRVLIADDDAVFRRRVSHLLHAEGATVDEAQDGEEALQRVASHMPDLLMLDLLMPKFDGFEVLRRLRSDRRAVNLRILVVTVKDLHVGEKAYLTRKMASLVGKDDARLDFITEVVTRALAPEPELSASVAN
jgi:CheY-like chemotaxis protein